MLFRSASKQKDSNSLATLRVMFIGGNHSSWFCFRWVEQSPPLISYHLLHNHFRNSMLNITPQSLKRQLVRSAFINHNTGKKIPRMTRRVLVPVADGSEPIETVALVDTLRRAGTEVTVASVSGQKMVTLAHKIKMEADDLIENVQEESFDGIFLPGGMPGTQDYASFSLEFLCSVPTMHSWRF